MVFHKPEWFFPVWRQNDSQDVSAFSTVEADSTIPSFFRKPNTSACTAIIIKLLYFGKEQFHQTLKKIDPGLQTQSQRGSLHP
jgi:hypothetical protein